MKTGFVILNYNTSELTAKLAQHIAQYEEIDYVVIVDNCSTDNSRELLRSITTNKIVLHETESNGGYSSGNNYGAQICKSLELEIMFIANPDVEITREDIQKILTAFETSDYSLLTCVQYEIDGSVGQPPIQVRYTYWDDLIECFWVGRKLLKTNYGKPLDKNVDIQEMNMFRGSFFGIRLADYLAVGGFDERFFLYCEERVLSKRLEDNSKRIGILTNARYDHMHSQSISGTYRQLYRRMKLMYDSRMLYNKLYNNIGIFRKALLWCSMKLSLVEFALKDAFHK